MQASELAKPKRMPPRSCRGQHRVRGDGVSRPTPHTSAPALHLHEHPLPHCPLPANAGAQEPTGTPSTGGSKGLRSPDRAQWWLRAPAARWAGLQAGTRHSSRAAEMLQPPDHPARWSSTSPAQSGRWGREVIRDQFADRKRLNLSNKWYQLSLATCSQTLNCSGAGSALLLSGYFHFSSFQPCLRARLLRGRQRTAVTQRTGPVTSTAPTLGDLGPWAPSPLCPGLPKSRSNTFLLLFKKQSSTIEAHKSFLRTSIPSTATA